ncbi:MAG: MarR family transcriptional regulator [Flavobacteriales bacterium]|nr:MarR family transcriptional regulator [Flavobacteriales bacterium]
MSIQKNPDVAAHSKSDFFAKGKKIAAAADKKSKLTPSKTIWFEDHKDLLKFLSENKFDLINLIRNQPMSISDLARKLHRNRASVTKDVNTLEEFGLVKSEMTVNAGHGRVRMIKPATKSEVTLQIRF